MCGGENEGTDMTVVFNERWKASKVTSKLT